MNNKDSMDQLVKEITELEKELYRLEQNCDKDGDNISYLVIYYTPNNLSSTTDTIHIGRLSNNASISSTQKKTLYNLSKQMLTHAILVKKDRLEELCKPYLKKITR